MSLLKRFYQHEEGATMTEFVMTLPMFIFCFVGIVQLGLFSERSIKVWANAHRETFDPAVSVSQTRFSLVHMQPAVGAAYSGVGLLTGSKPLNQTGVQRGIVLAAETATYGGMALKGHWGESSMRTLPVDALVDMRWVEGKRTTNSNTIIGSSALARDLLDETSSFSGSGGGALGAINALLSGSGARPAMAAGQRYGAVVGRATDSMTVAHRSVNMSAHFNTLVPPFPLEGFEAGAVPLGVVRLTMESHSPYKEILGIRWSQPYPGGSISVPTIPFPL